MSFDSSFFFHLNSSIKTRLLRKLRKSIFYQISCFPCLPVLDFFHSSEIRKKRSTEKEMMKMEGADEKVFYTKEIAF